MQFTETLAKRLSSNGRSKRVIFRQRPITNEFNLLVQCCGWRFAGGEVTRIEQLAARADWPSFVALSQRHRVQGLVWDCLRNIADAIPASVAATLSDAASAIAQHNLRSAQLAGSLLDAFVGVEVPMIFLKGLALSKLAYGDPFLKMGWDIDILVPADAVEAAATELRRLDFRLIVPAVDPATVAKWHRRRRESVWLSRDGLHVELHSRLTDSFDLIPSTGIGSTRQDVLIAPGVSLPTLGHDETFAYLCVHGAWSAWFRLKWITDFAALFHRCSAEEIGRLYGHAQALGAGRTVDQALILASRLYGLPWGSGHVRGVSRWLAKVAWNQMMREEEPTSTMLGTLPIHYTQLFLQRGLRFKVREAARQARDWVGGGR